MKIRKDLLLPLSLFALSFIVLIVGVITLRRRPQIVERVTLYDITNVDEWQYYKTKFDIVESALYELSESIPDLRSHCYSLQEQNLIYRYKKKLKTQEERHWGLGPDWQDSAAALFRLAAHTNAPAR